MAGEDLSRSWRRTEAHLRRALAHQDLPDDLRHWVLEFIDHSELGLAFETLVRGLVEARAALATPAREALASEAREMGLERNEDWLALTS